jgi:hypothetical protein
MQEYVVIELQTNAEGRTSAIPISYEDIDIARQKYYTILAAAAVSDLPVHGAVILNPVNPEGLAMGLVVEQYIFRRGEHATGSGE